MLHYYGQDTHYETVKEWYDGYRFGNADVYCPWDVINYCDAHRRNPMLPPENYWTNTSGNDVLKHFIESAGAAKGLAKTDLERLVNGEIVEKDIREDLTYNELYASMDNLCPTLSISSTNNGNASRPVWILSTSLMIINKGELSGLFLTIFSARHENHFLIPSSPIVSKKKEIKY